MDNVESDILIIGTGIAGLFCALNIDENHSIIMITNSKPKKCNTYLAQGGISVARDNNDIEKFEEDTMSAGTFNNDFEAVEILAKESRECIDDIVGLGVIFDRKNGEYHYTRESAHSTERILHRKDYTGKEIFEKLYNEVLKRKNIQIIEDMEVIDLLTDGNKCTGAVGIKDNNIDYFRAKITVIATGGVGGVFRSTTNRANIKGVGLSIALRKGIKTKDINYIQFHPTALYSSITGHRKFLISESARGEGGKLKNIRGERFVDELLPRDKVTKAIQNEMKKTNSEYVFLDMTHLDEKYVKERFPNIYNECRNYEIDITKDLIPVVPVQHYLMGGIDVDLNSAASMENLYACGEVSCTGVHGSNRLASNSLLESLVFSKRAAKDINNKVSYIKMPREHREYTFKELKEIIEQNAIVLKDKLLELRGDLSDELDFNR